MSDDDTVIADDEGGAEPAGEVADDVAPGAVPAATAKAVCEFLVRSLVRHPDEVKVHIVEGHPRGPRLDVTVADGDMGRVIGKRGRTANAIRSVVRAAAVRDDIDVAVEFVD